MNVSVCVCKGRHMSVCVSAESEGSLTEGDYGPWQARIRTMCPA